MVRDHFVLVDARVVADLLAVLAEVRGCVLEEAGIVVIVAVAVVGLGVRVRGGVVVAFAAVGAAAAWVFVSDVEEGDEGVGVRW